MNSVRPAKWAQDLKKRPEIMEQFTVVGRRGIGNIKDICACYDKTVTLF